MLTPSNFKVDDKDLRPGSKYFGYRTLSSNRLQLGTLLLQRVYE